MAGQQIAAPPRQLRALSLINPAITPDALEDERWELGYTYAPRACGTGGGIYDPCNPPTLEPPRRPANIEGEPFVVWEGDDCSTLGITNDDEFKARAREALTLCQSVHISREFWRGDQAQASGWPNKYLASDDADVVTDGQTAVVDVLACLEGALASCGCGGRGMIHATAQLVTHWSSMNLVRRESGLLLTINDTIVVADAGYDGSGPPGNDEADPEGDAGGQWAYATGLVTIKLGPVSTTPDTLGEAMDRTLNNGSYIAWRPVAVTFDGCCHAAAQADVDVCATAGVS